MSGVATAIGPFLGGWLVQAVSRRLIFVINLPVAGMIVAVSVRHLPESRDRGMTGRVDITGGILATPGWPGRSCHPPVSRPRSALMSLRPRSGRSRRVSAWHRRSARSGGRSRRRTIRLRSSGQALLWIVRPFGCPAEVREIGPDKRRVGSNALAGRRVGPQGQHDIHDVAGQRPPVEPGVVERGRGAER
ncbi:MAG TPA: hypothetical protein VGL33_05820 [Streptosporangiaceae bacterium]